VVFFLFFSRFETVSTPSGNAPHRVSARLVQQNDVVFLLSMLPTTPPFCPPALTPVGGGVAFHTFAPFSVLSVPGGFRPRYFLLPVRSSCVSSRLPLRRNRFLQATTFAVVSQVIQVNATFFLPGFFFRWAPATFVPLAPRCPDPLVSSILLD